MMLAVAANPEQYPALRARDLRLEDLQDPRARQVYLALEECFRAEQQGLRALVERIDDADLRTLILEKAATEEFGGEPRGAHPRRDALAQARAAGGAAAAARSGDPSRASGGP